MDRWSLKTVGIALVVGALSGCQSLGPPMFNADYIITNGQVFLGDGSGLQRVDIAICDQTICAITPSYEDSKITATKVIDVQGQIVSPGFIDPHTHSLEDLSLIHI